MRATVTSEEFVALHRLERAAIPWRVQCQCRCG
jgi:hypothetical protein